MTEETLLIDGIQKIQCNTKTLQVNDKLELTKK